MKFSVANHALVAANTEATEWMSARFIGEAVQVRALTSTEQKFRAYVFMTLTKIADAAHLDNDQMRAALLIETGRYQMVKLHGGPTVYVVKSMNTSLTHEELTEFWEDAKPIIRRDLLPDIGEADAEVIEELLKA